MVMRRFCYLLLCLFVWQLNFAADLKETFDVKLQNGLKMRIEVCEEGIFRIQVTPHDQYSESLLQRYQILKADWTTVVVSKKEDRQRFQLSTAHYTLAVNKQTGAVSVADNKGRNIVEQLLFHPSSDKLCEQLGEVINKKFLD